MKEKQPICFIGSSVTYGFATNGHSFVEIIEEKTKIPCHKFAVSGTTITDINNQSYYHRLITQIDTKIPYCCFVIQLSTNDTTQHLPLGERHSLDKNTIIGALNRMIEYIRNHWKHVPIVLYSNPPFENEEYENFAASIHLDYLTDSDNIGYMDFFNFYDPIVFQHSAMMADSIHPNKKGYEYMARSIYHKIADFCLLPNQWDD